MKRMGKSLGNVKNISKLQFRGRLRRTCTLGADFSFVINAPEFLQMGVLFSFGKRHIKELQKTLLEKIPIGSW